ncbi:MAG: DUF1569 domain-containing protein [Bryobacteraceae bacterium]
MKSLDRDKQEVLRRVAALRADSARRWGKMSCHQMVVHLSDSFLCGMGEKRASPARAPMPRGIYKWLGLYVPMPWPRGLATRPEMEQGAGGTAPVEFSRDREKLVELIDRFTNAREDLAKHPIFGEMSKKDWLRWGYLHCDHHLRQFGV